MKYLITIIGLILSLSVSGQNIYPDADANTYEAFLSPTVQHHYEIPEVLTPKTKRELVRNISETKIVTQLYKGLEYTTIPHGNMIDLHVGGQFHSLPLKQLKRKLIGVPKLVTFMFPVLSWAGPNSNR